MAQSQTINEIVIDQAIKVAKRDLNSCYLGAGIIAGKKHFDDYWARDSFFASWGFIALGDFEKVKSNLDFFLKFQNREGLIPRRIDRFFLTRLKYLAGIRIPRFRNKPIFAGRFYFPNIDPNSIFVITSQMYVKSSGDIKWIENNIVKINKALLWLKEQDRDRDGLIDEGILANWMDTVQKEGETFYSNLLAWKALEAGEELNKLAGKEFLSELSDWKREIKNKINDCFWNGEYFSDWVNKGKRFDYFATDGNMLAIVLGFADKNQTKNILLATQKYFGKDVLPMPVNYPSYPKKYLALRHSLSGLPGYHNAYGRWLWIASLSALANKKQGNDTRFLQEISVVSDWISAKNKVYEVYKPNGEPYHRLFWESESPFAWNAGIFIWVVKELGLL